jgi:chromosome segregation ATPase
MSDIEALKDNELIPGMNKFIDHIHHLTMENKKLKEQLKDQDQMFTNERDDLMAQLDHSHYHYGKLKEQLEKEKSVGDDIEDLGKCYREENKKLKKELELFKTGSKQLLESKEAWERLCDETNTLLQKTNHMMNQEKEKADFYEKMFTELRSSLHPFQSQ